MWSSPHSIRSMPTVRATTRCSMGHRSISSSRLTVRNSPASQRLLPETIRRAFTGGWHASTRPHIRSGVKTVLVRPFPKGRRFRVSSSRSIVSLRGADFPRNPAGSGALVDQSLKVMKVVRFDKYGGIDVLQVIDVPVPEPAQDEV